MKLIREIYVPRKFVQKYGKYDWGIWKKAEPVYQ